MIDFQNTVRRHDRQIHKSGFLAIKRVAKETFYNDRDTFLVTTNNQFLIIPFDDDQVICCLFSHLFCY